MRKRILWVLTLAASLNAYAGEVSQQSAMQKAQSFLANRLNKQGGGRRAAQDIRLQAASSGHRELHVFNAEGGGFVILSANDQTAPVLGYSTSGRFNSSDLPPALQQLLLSYAEQIRATDSGSTTDDDNSSITYPKEDIAPLIKSQWDQDKPYNNQVPTYMDSDNQEVHAATGCVATAMAMVMKYHQWPQEACAPITGYKDDDSQREDLPATTFNWSAMTDKYDEHSSQESCEAVAALMKYCGYAVRMGYGSSSDSNSYHLARALYRYFGYDPQSIMVTRRAHYTEGEWLNMVYDELAAKRPVIAGGAAHEFIIDGYQNGEFFHFNWGWSGKDDGYFRISTNSENQKVNTRKIPHFPYEIVIGIKPTTQPYEDPSTLTTSGLRLNDNMSLELTRNSNGTFPNIAITTVVTNSCADVTLENFDAGYGLYQDGKAPVFYPIQYNFSLEWNKYKEGITGNLQLPKELPDGDYTIYPVSRPAGSGTWLPNDDAEPCYLDVNISGDKLTINCSPRHYGFTINSMEFTGNKTVGGKVDVKVNITNNSEYGYDGILVLADDISGLMVDASASEMAAKYINLPAGETKDVMMEFYPDKAKTYNCRVLHEAFLLGKGFELEIASSGGDDDMSIDKEVTVQNIKPYEGASDGESIYSLAGRKYSAAITLTNNNESTFTGDVEAAFILSKRYELGDSLNLQKYENKITIKPGEKFTFNFEYDHVESGMNYTEYVRTSYQGVKTKDPKEHIRSYVAVGGINVYHDNQSLTSYEPDKAFTVPADAVTVELAGCGVESITPNSNPNCLFFLDSEDQLPEGLPSSGQNVVRMGDNYTAKEMVITDDKPFYTPFAFTAEKATYTRTFTEAEKTGYTSLTLPFNVKSMTVDRQDVAPEFYVFCGDQLGKVYVTKVDELPIAGEPYLVKLPVSFPVGKTATFSSQNTEVSNVPIIETAGYYRLKGTTLKETCSDIEAYTIAGAGIKRVTECAPFRAVFQALAPASTLTQLTLDDTTLGIDNLRETMDTQLPYYNLRGQRITHPTTPGIYIQGGRKVIVK